jgi:HSP20 family protein
MFLVPFTRNTELARTFDRLFDDNFDRFFGLAPATEGGPRSPALDVTENDTAYTVKFDMPGVTKDDIKVSVDGRLVSVQAETKREEEKKEGDRVVYRERSVQSFARSFTLPMDVSSPDAGAKLENGVLTLVLPKAQLRSASRIAVK